MDQWGEKHIVTGTETCGRVEEEDICSHPSKKLLQDSLKANIKTISDFASMY